jgi:hypothetical protein
MRKSFISCFYRLFNSPAQPADTSIGKVVRIEKYSKQSRDKKK